MRTVECRKVRTAYPTRLHLSNFKAWKNLDIKLNRVTGLFGTNSSGKSSILQFLLMLKQTKNATDRGLVLDLGGPDQLVNLGTFNDMVHKHQDSSPLKWTIKWELTKTLKIANPSGKRTEILFQGNVLETAAEVSFKNQEMKSQRLAYRFAQHSFEMKPKEATKDYLLQASSQLVAQIFNLFVKKVEFGICDVCQHSCHIFH